jgi:PKD repeat protein
LTFTSVKEVSVMSWPARFSVGVVALSVVAASFAEAAAPAFTKLNPAAKPTNRRSCGAAIQPLAGKDRMWVFSGFGDAGYRTDLWYYDTLAANWALAVQSGTPSKRDFIMPDWERNQDVLILFGGHFAADALTHTDYNDLYMYDPATTQWSPLTVSGSKPSVRGHYILHWVPHLGKFILFGGKHYVTSIPWKVDHYNDLWLLSVDKANKTASWTQVSPGGSVPSARSASCSGYDPDHKRLIIFGGDIAETMTGSTTVNDTYQYDVDANIWIKDTPSGTIPSKRSTCFSSYDPLAKRLMLHGGWNASSQVNGTFAYDPAASPPTWTSYTLSPSPGSREDGGTRYSAALGGVLMFGGAAGAAYQDETWLLRTNRPPTADTTGTPTSVSEDVVVTLDGTHSSDPDSDPLTYTWVQISGTSVTITGGNNATAFFTSPRVTQASPLVFQLSVNDGNANASATVTITVNDTIDEPPNVVTNGNQSVAAGAIVTLNGSGSTDPNPGETASLVYQWTQVSGTVVVLSNANTAVATFTAPTPGSTITLVFRLTVTDARGGSRTADVSITVSPASNTPPVAEAGNPQTRNENVLVTLNGSGSIDADGDTLTYQWSQTAGPGVTLSSTIAVKPTFTTPTVVEDTILTFQLVVRDGKVDSTPDFVNVTVLNNVNEPPTAEAGANATYDEAQVVALDGSGTDPNPPDTLSYSWTQTSGPLVTLSSAVVAKPTFTTPSVVSTQSLVFQLQVTDNHGTSATDSVTITVNNSINDAPVANAGTDQTKNEGVSVTLDGSGSSDPNPGETATLTYLWTQTDVPPVPTVVLSSTAAQKPTFTTPTVFKDEYLHFSLVVTDTHGQASAADEVIVTVKNNVNEPPVADAGIDKAVDEGVVASLNGSGSSDPNSDPLSYAWTQVSGLTVGINNASTATATFTSPSVTGQASLVFKLTVDDGKGGVTSDQVTVTVNDTVNEPPSANAGADQTVGESEVVTLDGSGSSDPNPGETATLTYQWTQLSGISVTLDNPTLAMPRFTAPTVLSDAALIFQLQVTDTRAGTSTDTVKVTVTNTINEPPTVSVDSDSTVLGGANVTVSGAGADPNGDTLSYQWVQVGGTAVTLSGAMTATASFTAPQVAASDVLTFSLQVSDGKGGTASAQVHVTVNPNLTGTPSANAGSDQTPAAGAVVTLDGSQSSDPNNAPLTYAWSQTGGPGVSLSSLTVVKPTFTAPVLANAVNLTFSLTVSNGNKTSVPDFVVIHVARQEYAPVACVSGTDQVLSGESFVLDGTCSTDANNDSLSFVWAQTGGPSVSMSEPSLTVQSLQAPTLIDETVLTFSLVVSDGALSSDPYVVTVTVVPTGQLPRIVSIARKLTAYDQAYIYDSSDSHVEALGLTPITFALVTGPQDFAVTSDGVVTYTPKVEGTFAVRIRATNQLGVDEQAYDLRVVAAPLITSLPNMRTPQTRPYRYDADGIPEAVGSPPIRWRLVEGPSDMVVVEDTGEVFWTPLETVPVQVVLKATNAFGHVEQAFTLEVENTAAPRFTCTANTEAVVGTPYRFDEDNVVDVFPAFMAVQVANGPAGYFVDNTTRQVSWIPRAAGVFAVSLAVVGGYSLAEHAGLRYDYDVTVIAAPQGQPSALVQAIPASGDVPLEVDFDASLSSPSPGRSMIAYEWRFGDGSPKVFGQQASHLFATPGGYSVQLKVVDDLGLTAEDEIQVLVGTGGVLPPIVSLSADRVVGRDRLKVSFACDCSDPQERALNYSWEFGDGDLSGDRSIDHEYVAPGSYHVRLTVSNGALISTAFKTITVSAGDHVPPEVEAFAEPTAFPSPVLVKFTSVTRDADGTIRKRLWTFPDDTTSDLPEAVHRFESAGVFDVRLEVTDSDDLTSHDDVRVEILSEHGAYPPQIVSVGSRKAVAGQLYQYDEDGMVAARGERPLRFRLGREQFGQTTDVPQDAIIDESTGLVSWRPMDPGVFALTIAVTNEVTTTYEDLVVQVDPSPDQPVTVGRGCAAVAGGGLAMVAVLLALLFGRRRRSIFVVALIFVASSRAGAEPPTIVSTAEVQGVVDSRYMYDEDGRADAVGSPVMEWFLAVNPADMAINNLTGEIYWMPLTEGVFPIEIGVKNDDGEARQAFTVTVDGDVPPKIQPIAITTVELSSFVSFQVLATGTEPIVWQIVSGPAGMEIYPAAGVVLWMASQAGPQEVVFRAANVAGVDTYSWTLEVVGGSLAEPTAVLAARPEKGDAPLRVDFDGSGSSSNTPGTDFILWNWMFDDGSAALWQSVPSISHVYSEPGIYVATLAVGNAYGNSAGATVAVVVTDNGGMPPRAAIVASVSEGPAPLTVVFQCDCTPGDTPIKKYRWEYGDGETSALPAPQHVFGEPAGYNVKLQVEDERGLRASATAYLAVLQGDLRPPEARAFANPTSGDVPLVTRFIAEYGDSDGLVMARRWFLPDGTVVANQDPIRTFDTVGSFVATLEVEDEDGLKSRDTVGINVTRNGALPPEIVSAANTIARVGEAWQYDEDGLPAARGSGTKTWGLGKVSGEQVVSVPSGMEIDESTGRISWTPTADQAGENPVTLKVTNVAGSDFQDFKVAVLSAGKVGSGVPAGCDCSGAGTASSWVFLSVACLVLCRSDRRARSRLRPRIQVHADRSCRV